MTSSARRSQRCETGDTPHLSASTSDVYVCRLRTKPCRACSRSAFSSTSSSTVTSRAFSTDTATTSQDQSRRQLKAASEKAVRRQRQRFPGRFCRENAKLLRCYVIVPARTIPQFLDGESDDLLHARQHGAHTLVVHWRGLDRQGRATQSAEPHSRNSDVSTRMAQQRELPSASTSNTCPPKHVHVRLADGLVNGAHTRRVFCSAGTERCGLCRQASMHADVHHRVQRLSVVRVHREQVGVGGDSAADKVVLRCLHCIAPHTLARTKASTTSRRQQHRSRKHPANNTTTQPQPIHPLLSTHPATHPATPTDCYLHTYTATHALLSTHSHLHPHCYLHTRLQ